MFAASERSALASMFRCERGQNPRINFGTSCPRAATGLACEHAACAWLRTLYAAAARTNSRLPSTTSASTTAMADSNDSASDDDDAPPAGLANPIAHLLQAAVGGAEGDSDDDDAAAARVAYHGTCTGCTLVP